MSHHWEDDWEESDEYAELSCDNCGPWCEHWAGDGLCMLAIEQQAAEWDDYYAKYVTKNVHCPVCGAKLTMYAIPTDKLWTWPGHFYNPMIALDIFCVYDAPKGEIHNCAGIHHIWTGTGKLRQEKLIHLIPSTADSDFVPVQPVS